MESLGTVEKALDVLFHLNRVGAGGVTAIGRELGLPKSTAHRLLQALGRRGLVERDERGRYRPGIGLVALGLGVLEAEPVVAAARPLLEEAARELGETLFLAGARAGQVVVLDQVEGTAFLRAAPRVGEAVPVHATAVGRLYLAFDPDLVALEEPFERFTARTPRSAAALAREVARTRRRGWAESREEWMPGVRVLAAPVRAGGRLAGALALAAPSVRLPTERGPALAARLVELADRAAVRLTGGRS
ncbi:MAG: IclR family transcriptional regulator [Myxococcota bacterium]|nr:IclR family transcriptional regulator [Myxococcota bacterium]